MCLLGVGWSECEFGSTNQKTYTVVCQVCESLTIEANVSEKFFIHITLLGCSQRFHSICTDNSVSHVASPTLVILSLCLDDTQYFIFSNHTIVYKIHIL